jgi:hypothetical protein
MNLKRKGIVETLALLYVVLAFLGGVILWKPTTGLLGIGNQPQKQKSSISKKSEKKPELVWIDQKTGKQYFAYSEKYQENSIDTSEESQLTIWQKLKNLGLIGVILVIVFPGFGLWMFRMFLKARDNFKQLVTGIEEARKKLPPEAMATLENDLSKKTNLDTKELVKKIKVKL